MQPGETIESIPIHTFFPKTTGPIKVGDLPEYGTIETISDLLYGL